jgi:hypothetical protein
MPIDKDALTHITGLSNGDGTFTMKFESVELDDEPKISKRAEILHEAEHCICGQREQDYGSPEDNFGTIAQMWTAYTGTLITALDVAMMMCLLKIARIKNGGGTGDSFVDLAGYAACGGEIHESTT